MPNQISNSESQVELKRNPWRMVLWWTLAIISAIAFGGILIIWRAKSDVETHWAGREDWYHLKVELKDIEFSPESWVLLNFRVSEVKDLKESTDAQRLLDEILGPDERSTSWSLRKFEVTEGRSIFIFSETKLDLIIDP